MSTRQAESEGDSSEQEAARWIARRNTGWTAADARAFADWCAADPRHAAAAAEVEATERLLSRLPETREASQFWREIDALTHPHKKDGGIARFPQWSSVAAAAAVVLLLTVGAVAFSVLAPFERAYSTATNATQQLTLPDGSQVTLAEESSLNIRYSRSERLLLLLTGEAEFAVTKDADRPFLVAAGAFSVRAVGTAFSVRHQDAGGIQVVVTEGQVRVSQADDAAGHRLPGFAGPGLLLAAGESMQWEGSAASEPLVVRHSVERSTSPAVTDIPRLVFANTSLQEAVDQLNRHSTVQIEIADSSLAARAVGGGLRGDSAEAFVAALAANGDIIVERPSPGRIVLRQAP